MEGKLRQTANPHCEKRMELILKQLEESVAKTEEVACEDAEDEVSFIYCGEIVHAQKIQCANPQNAFAFWEVKNAKKSATMT